MDSLRRLKMVVVPKVIVKFIKYPKNGGPGSRVKLLLKSGRMEKSDGRKKQK